MMTNCKVFSSIDEDSSEEKNFMFDNNIVQHSFFQDFLTQNMSQYSQSHENKKSDKLSYSLYMTTRGYPSC